MTVGATAAGRRLQQRLRAVRSDALGARLAEFSAEELSALHESPPAFETIADALKRQRLRT